ncbi:SLC5A9 [Mytilus coruscus]|uniref:SLC5A9 n=1 Tax=Mytilus coruscus TaxID=42192 RepID=A0A6J8BZQ2_MYTCO|nr:SLC5A9 [Mytilus coruscus]
MADNSTIKAFSSAGVTTVDLVVIVIYLLLCLATGIWATWRTQRGSISGYFLAGRDMIWVTIGASLFASNIGSGSFVGLAGTGAANGIAVASYELNVDMYAGSIFIQQAVGWDLYTGVIVLLAISAIYTISGGLKAVIYTDTLQTVIMVAGAIVLMVLAFIKVGGLEKIYVLYPEALPSPLIDNSSCGHPTDEAFHLLRDAVTGDIPWPGNVFGISILSCWYFCSDQVLVQRSLAAKNMHHVKGGSILAAYLKILPLFTTVFPGMISRILYTDQIACVDPAVCKIVCDNAAGCTNIAYPKLVVELMPEGLRGLMLAAMMAALMSSLTSVFNSSSTIFTMDIWKRIRAGASDGELLVVGRIFIIALVVISIIWIPVLQASQGGQLFNYIQSVTGYLAPPVLSLFLLAMLWKRTNEKGAFWGSICGLIVGLVRMGLDFGYGSPKCGEEDTRPTVISKVHFLHFTIFLFFFSMIVTIVVSLVTKPVDEKHHISREPYPEEILWEEKSERLKTNQASKKRTTEEIPTWRKVVYMICGYEKPKEITRTEEEKLEQIRLLTHIKEDPNWKLFVNLNALLLMCIGIFMWAFFA